MEPFSYKMRKRKCKYAKVYMKVTMALTIYLVTGHLSEGSFARNGVVQIPKFDANPNHNPSPNRNLCLYV